MSRTALLRGASAWALFIVAVSGAAKAQEALPAIDVGANQGSLAASASSHDPARSSRDDAVKGSPQDPTAYKVWNSVSATKTDTPIMQTPVSVDVVPRQVIEDQQAVVIDTATKNVSSVFTTPYVGLQGGWNIRGFVDYAYYQDGVRVNPWSALPPRDTVDVQQVEIVKGPSSILYGRMQPGGLVEVTTKAPQAEPHYEIQQLFESFSGYRTALSMTGPVTADKSLLYRFDASYQNENSFVDGLHNRHFYLAPKIYWRPTEDTSATVYLQFYNGYDGIYNGLPAIYSSNVPKWMNSVAAVPRSANYGSTDGNLQTNSDFRFGYSFVHDFNKDWKITSRLDINIRDIPENWIDVFNPDPGSCTLFSCPVYRDAFKFMTKEQNYFTSLELTGHFDTLGAGHTVLVGADGYLTNDDNPYYGNWSLVPPVNLFSPGYPTRLMQFAPLADTVARFAQRESWYGVYLQDQIKLPYNFFVLAGFRYDAARSITSYPQYYPSYSPDYASVPSDAIKPRVGLLWQPIPQLSLYGNYIEGFGVSNGVGVDLKPLPPQQSAQWEAGAKLSLLDDRLTATAAWFHIVKTNVTSPTQSGFLAISQTTGAVRNTGVEFDVQGQLTPEVKIIGSYANIDSKIISDTAGGGAAGNRWWGVPRNSGNLWVVYEPQFQPVKGFAFGAGFNARGSVEVNAKNSFTLPAYTVVDLMSRYSFDYLDHKVTLQFNVSNLLNKTYYTTQGWLGGFIAGAPQTFKGSVKVEF
jgi:iron complex outermembrane recepter protein